ncbi:MAG: flagellar M-ring protein FliF [Gammaproteobacteria bacterium]|nr:flagellar M-ring protein FliF [Gammaproteobacteria bacterium]
MNKNKIALVLSVVVLAAFTVGFYLFLYSDKAAPVINLSDYKNANRITEFFDRNGIQYTVNEENQILVDEKNIDSVRQSLALNGITSESGVGFELFSESDYGMTEFAQNVNYQRAVQGELERTIMSIESITNARVHVNIPKNKGLFKQKEASTASILLHIRDGETLSNYQTAGIKELVSAAINNIDGANIKIIDQNGNILSGDNNTMHVKPRENELEQKLAELLEINYDLSSFKVSVNISFKRNDKEVTTEIIAPDNKTFVASEETSSSSKTNSNGNKNTQSKKQYRYSRRVETEVLKGDQIDSISASVIFNKPLSELDTQKIESLVKSAIGFKEARGDTVDVIVLGTANSNQKITSSIEPNTADNDEGTSLSNSMDELLEPGIDEPKTEVTQSKNGQASTDNLLNNDVVVLGMLVIAILLIAILAMLIHNWSSNRRALSTLKEIRNA